MPVRQSNRPTKWNRDLILQTLRAWRREGRDLSYNAVARTSQALVSAANYHYGSYRRAVMMAGIDYADIRRKPHWDKGRVVERLRAAHRAGEDLSWRAVSERRDELGHAAMAAVHPRLFGNWNRALRAAGVDVEQVRRHHKWDPEQVTSELRRRYRRGEPVNSGAVQRERPGLYGFATQHFGGYDNALRAAGLNPGEVRQRRQWTREDVLREMREFGRTHGGVSQTVMRQLDSGLERAAGQLFGSVSAARRAAERGGGHPGERGREKGERTPERGRRHPGK